MGRVYNENGRVMEEVQYTEGMPASKKVFFPNGKIKEEWNYSVSSPDDLAVVKSYNPDGTPAGEKVVKKKKPKKRKKKKAREKGPAAAQPGVAR